MTKDKINWQAELPLEASQKRETFARYGLAIYHAQCVEKQIGILLATSFNRKFMSVSPGDKEYFFSDAFQKTMGHLLKTIKEKVKIEPTLYRRLTKALNLRNWLTHNYFWERAGSLLTWDGREKMITELTKASDELNALDNDLTTITVKWLKANGISESQVEEELKKYKQGKDA